MSRSQVRVVLGVIVLVVAGAVQSFARAELVEFVNELVEVTWTELVS